MKTAQIPAYRRGIREWLEINDNQPVRDLESLSVQEREDAVRTVLSVSRAYCNFQDIVSGKIKLQRSKVSFREKLKLWQEWAEEE